VDWWNSDNAWAMWLGLSIVLGVAELASLDLVLLMLAAGALGGMLTALLGAGVVLQVLVASAVAVAMLAVVRPGVVARLHSGPDLKHGPAALIGTEGYALIDVTSREGQVKLGGEVWTARPYSEGETIPAGATVQVLEIRGATAYVHEVPALGS
jgi:membrane protein implicated in regulation of membrane protease activity